MSKTPSLVMIFLGVLAILLPFSAGIAIEILFGVLLLLAGATYGFLALHSRGTSAFLWRLFVCVAFLVAGFVLLIRPAAGLVTLTLIVAIAFLMEAIAELISYIGLRQHAGATWLLINALITLVVAMLIWQNWPASSVWAIGTLVGVNLITSGLTPMMFSPSQTIKRL